MASRAEATPPAAARPVVRVSLLASAWALGYALYRGYYGLGGTFAMIGVPASQSTWQAINLIAAALLLGAAALPLLAVRPWTSPWPRRFLVGTAWVITVACVGHALINGVLRVLSLAGLYDVSYPPEVWLSVDETAADLQDLFFNEPWFFVQGLLWAGIAWLLLGPSSARRWWVASASTAIVVATGIGLLSAFGVIRRVVIG